MVKLCKNGLHERTEENLRQVRYWSGGREYVTSFCIPCRRKSSKHYERITPSRNKSRHRKANP